MVDQSVEWRERVRPPKPPRIMTVITSAETLEETRMGRQIFRGSSATSLGFRISGRPRGGTRNPKAQALSIGLI